MFRLVRTPSRPAVAAALALALPMSQLGHGIAYLVRYGPGAVGRQSTAEHAYFPVLFESTWATAGAVLLAALLLIAVARFMTSLRSGRHFGNGWPLLGLVLVLMSTQTVIYALQEVLELSGAGLPPPDPAGILAGALTGQLPVAILAAVILRWLSASVSRAITRLQQRPVAPTSRFQVLPAPLLQAGAAPVPAHVHSPFPKRGPPLPG